MSIFSPEKYIDGLVSLLQSICVIFLLIKTASRMFLFFNKYKCAFYSFLCIIIYTYKERYIKLVSNDIMLNHGERKKFQICMKIKELVPSSHTSLEDYDLLGKYGKYVHIHIFLIFLNTWYF